MTEFSIGIDCGGTHTVAIAYDQHADMLRKSVQGPANLAVDPTEAVKNIHAAILAITQSLNEKDCNKILIGIAGLSAFNEIEQLIAELDFPNLDIKIINDAQLALIARLKGQNGLVAIAGTGSVVTGIVDNRSVRVGGWGHLLGDEGSGYQISKLAFQQVTKETDLDEISNFSKAFLKEIGAKNITDLISIFYKLNKKEVANFTPFVLKEAKDGDKVAQSIVETATKGLADQINLAMNKTDWQKSTLNLAFSGSVVEKSSYYRQLLIKKINCEHQEINILPVESDFNNAIAVIYAK
ncbi:hypothetical protein M5C72_00340 [Companilactobacillus allii]|uniref:ATPase BadF/BadG/BcrA/BcrD type domain-containing protein n=1 Tax=Companilactobacillus allii TaxID=1847728 RepID=A0A1P8Q1A0_9LACO|nr:BadF/BadG/BcrA/BcrD ATPase family protein [Companilactobacillus allii]APX71638.1 hypothetical protein BTM29_03280 [Companilactobacillus allii]USQ68720.1 hypothetical protein M5C72_00340 [Companilactobacillus allii]